MIDDLLRLFAFVALSGVSVALAFIARDLYESNKQRRREDSK